MRAVQFVLRAIFPRFLWWHCKQMRENEKYSECRVTCCLPCDSNSTYDISHVHLMVHLVLRLTRYWIGSDILIIRERGCVNWTSHVETWKFHVYSGFQPSHFNADSSGSKILDPSRDEMSAFESVTWAAVWVRLTWTIPMANAISKWLCYWVTLVQKFVFGSNGDFNIESARGEFFDGAKVSDDAHIYEKNYRSVWKNTSQLMVTNLSDKRSAAKRINIIWNSWNALEASWCSFMYARFR